MNYQLQKEVNPFLYFLRDRFKAKIVPEEYYLSYSGGKDSHFLLWFIKKFLDDDKIKIVGVNTSFEIPEIRSRIMENSDVVLHPVMPRWEIKARYGIPCFSKQHDEYIYRYQHGNRSENTMRYIMGENKAFNLSKRARDLLLGGALHPVSNRCCKYNKELPMIRWGRESGRKPITGVRGSESMTRRAKYQACLNKSGTFTPIYDFSDALMDSIYEAYGIEIPSCYATVSRTGCAGCPYGRNVGAELSLLPDLQRQSTIKYFAESYVVKGVQLNELL